MTAMIMHSPAFTLREGLTNSFWKNSLAAGLAVALHAIVLTLLVSGWSVELPAPNQPMVLKTHLVMLPAAAQPEPQPPIAIAEPQLSEPSPVVEPTPVVPLPEPAKATVDPQIQAQKLEQAALAHKRVEEKKREQQAEKLQQVVEAQKRDREVEEQRLIQQRQHQQEQQAQQTKNAELARQVAERNKQQAAQIAADSRQYLPLSKEAPDYPQRALDKNIEGDCTVEYTVNGQGKIENPRVLDGCHPLFMRPSLAAANTFRYQPRTIDGQAVSVPAVRNTFHYRIK
jgi:protein TonB